MKTRILSESERNTAVNGLRVAAVRFKGHAECLMWRRCPNCLDHSGKDGVGRLCKTCGGRGDIPDTREAYDRLRKQFASQHSDSLMLASVIENAEQITIMEAEDVDLPNL